LRDEDGGKNEECRGCEGGRSRVYVRMEESMVELEDLRIGEVLEQ